jgi:hypothetical protein
MKSTNRRPANHEFGTYYAAYIKLVEGDDLLAILKKGKRVVSDFLQKIPKSKWDYSYGKEKWTIKEVLVHLIDTERVFAYRALRIARGDKTALSGFEQNDFVDHSSAYKRTPASIIAEYKAVREATIQLFKNLDSESLGHIGKASKNPLSALAAGYIIAGHEIHHLTIVRDKYL